MRDPAASRWLKNAIVDSSGRDPVDALADAEALAQLLKQRLELIQSGAEN